MENLSKLVAQMKIASEKISKLERERLDGLIREFAGKNKIPIYKIGVKIIPPYKEFRPNRIREAAYAYTPPTYEFYILSDEEAFK